MDGGDRGGGDAPGPARLGARLADRRRPARAVAPGLRPRGGRDARLGARARQRAAPDGLRRRRPAGRAARGAGRRPRPARAARGRRGHAPVRAVERRRGLPGRPLPVDLRLDARAGAARADVRAPRPRRGPRPRVGDPGAARPARARAAAARPRGQLAVLAGARHGARRRARADLRHVPARRDPAGVRRLRRVRRGDRRAAALRGVPRADLPVVGRAAAAAVRDDRDPHHGRADALGRQRHARRARPVRRAARGDRGLRPRGDRVPARGARREPLPRHARRHAGRVHRSRVRRAQAGAGDPRRAARRVRAARRGAGLRGGAGGRARARRRARRPPPAHGRRRRAGRSGRARPGDARGRARERLRHRARAAARARLRLRVSATARRASSSCGFCA